jgi:hypothetical protein
MTKTKQIITIAKRISKRIPHFNEPKKPGEGNIAANLFMKRLYEGVEQKLRLDIDYEKEKPIGDGTKSAVDFYIQDEKTIIEIALSLRNPSSEFHKDILKALLAKDNRWKVNRLVFVAKPGAYKRHKEGLSEKIKEWLEKHHSITVEIEDLLRQ